MSSAEHPAPSHRGAAGDRTRGDRLLEALREFLTNSNSLLVKAYPWGALVAVVAIALVAYDHYNNFQRTNAANELRILQAQNTRQTLLNNGTSRKLTATYKQRVLTNQDNSVHQVSVLKSQALTICAKRPKVPVGTCIDRIAKSLKAASLAWGK